MRPLDIARRQYRRRGRRVVRAARRRDPAASGAAQYGAVLDGKLGGRSVIFGVPAVAQKREGDARSANLGFSFAMLLGESER